MRIALSTMLAIAMQSGAAYLPNNWVASGSTNSSLPGTAFMDSVQVTNNKTGTGALMFADAPTITTSLTVTNGTTGTKPLVINGASGATVDQLTVATGGTNRFLVSNVGNATIGGQILAAGGTIGGTVGMVTTLNGVFTKSLEGTESIGFGSSAVITDTMDAFFRRDGAAAIQLGIDAASPINQTLKAADGSGTDKSGANLTLKGGYGTGTGRGGDLITMTSVSSNTTGAVVQYYSTRHYESAKPAPVTNSTASPLFNVLINTNHYLACKIFASTFASDVGGDFQAFDEELNVCAVNKAGTISSTVSTSWGTNLAASSASTLTTTWTAVTSGNSLDIKITPVSSLTPTTYYTKWKIDVLSNDPATITPQ